MNKYRNKIAEELETWKHDMLRDPSLLNKLSKRVQVKINKIIPEKVHRAITAAIKQMVRAVLFGAEFTTNTFTKDISLQVRDALAKEKIDFYKKTAAAEGGITGAGGILLGLADFPLLLGIKIKLLFELASIYGVDISNYKERVYILYIFQLAFSSPQHRQKIFLEIQSWEQFQIKLPEDIHRFEWQTFQQEYRDYIDIAKMAQLVPIIGAPIGAIVNYRLINKLGKTAINAYRMRDVGVNQHKLP